MGYQVWHSLCNKKGQTNKFPGGDENENLYIYCHTCIDDFLRDSTGSCGKKPPIFDCRRCKTKFRNWKELKTHTLYPIPYTLYPLKESTPCSPFFILLSLQTDTPLRYPPQPSGLGPKQPSTGPLPVVQISDPSAEAETEAESQILGDKNCCHFIVFLDRNSTIYWCRREDYKSRKELSNYFNSLNGWPSFCIT